MKIMSRRSVIRASLGVAATAPLARPYIANAQAKTAVYWAGQGFIPEEDVAMRKVCEDYMKESGNKIEYALLPFMALNQKTISALTSGDVPDLIFMDAPETILPQNAWDDKIIDVSDVVAPYEAQLSETGSNARPSTTGPLKSAATTSARSSRAPPRSTSGATSSRRLGSKCRKSPRTGMASGHTSNRFRRPSEPRVCGRSTPVVFR